MLAAILLAAGGSRRFGRANKLLAPLGGRALLDHGLDTLVALPAQRLIVVTGCDRFAIERVVRRRRDRRLRVVHNRDWSAGLAGSIQTGAAMLRPTDRTALVLLADMPTLDPHATRAVLRALAAGADAARPRIAGQPGHPAGFRVAALAGVRSTGDKGLWSALANRPGTRLVEVRGSRASGLDVDTQAALVALHRVGTRGRLPRLSATAKEARAWRK